MGTISLLILEVDPLYISDMRKRSCGPIVTKEKGENFHPATLYITIKGHCQ